MTATTGNGPLLPGSYLDLVKCDVAANRPTTPLIDGNHFLLFYATDTGVLSLWAGSWVTVGGSALTNITRNANVAAAGSALADAAQINAGATVVTGADGTKGVKLPATPAAGTVVLVKNVDAANAVLKIWPDAAATINAIAANASLNIAAKTSVLLWADSTTQWYSLPLLPS